MRQYYKKAVEILNKLGFVEGYVNPCIYVKKSKKNIALYVHDNLMLEDVEAIDEVIEPLSENWLVLKTVD